MRGISGISGVVAVGLLGLLWATDAPAQSPSAGQQQLEKSAGDVRPGGDERYTLKLCNDSARQSVYGAIAVYDRPTDDNVTVHAWFKIGQGACASVATRRFGNYASHSVFVHGYSGNFVWPPSKSVDLKLCVDRSRPYERPNSKNYKCRGNEVLRGFRKIKIERVVGDTALFTYTFK
ncbi:MAG: DUF1036 domain-containing protein [Xanthobacteraceae bacterium]|nr:DUF1036 domain-containing protein [Xanthobacteraceae bacterium]GIL02020.1 MAG: hypothetical protein BroJett030_19190 [Alphaproteobacteria bacterium]